MLTFFQFFSQKLRLSNPWRYKVPLLISFCYFLLLAGDVQPYVAFMSFLAAIGTTIGFTGFGYLTNDLADRKKDGLAGKSNGTVNLSKRSIFLLFITFLAIAILPWLYLPFNRVSVILIVVELVLFVLYAFPPFRLKERSYLGVLTDALYAHVVPAFLASWTFYLVVNESYKNFFFFIIALSVWQLFSGIRNILSHHYKDHENDIASGTNTFATRVGKEKVYKLMYFVFIPLEIVSMMVFLAFIQLEIDYLFIVLIAFGIFAWFNFRKVTSETRVKHFTNVFLDQFYIHWLPYIVLVAMTINDYSFGWLLVLHFALFNPFTNRFSSKTKVSGSQTKTAIISTNRSKYSETFIQAHIRLLQNVVVYSDGYFPTSFSLDRGETWENLSSSNSEKALIQSWKDNDVKVVLAEYGLAGAEVMNACEKANIPLIVHFHGFDAYRKDVLESYDARYKELFQVAVKIIVVSKDMHRQLLSLGCPEEKLEQITYGVDLELFSPPSSSEKRHGFIACGRFVLKKAPLITIQAFSKVVEVHPNAKLTFIGDGELLKAAIALTNELKLVANIDFKGVLNSSEVARELKNHAIFIQHSIKTEQNDSEGTPLSILEAAATGLAIVATNHAGIPDVIVDGESGYLVDEGDVARMAEKMVLLYSNPQLRNEFGMKAQKIIVCNYRQEDNIKRLENCLKTNELK
jgi:colanic acid/amylovoran biosynthesis glycosyltransferase